MNDAEKRLRSAITAVHMSKPSAREKRLAEALDLLTAALDAARAEGYAEAKAQAAERMDALVRVFSDAVEVEKPGTYPRELLEGATEDIRDALGDIRAMELKPCPDR